MNVKKNVYATIKLSSLSTYIGFLRGLSLLLTFTQSYKSILRGEGGQILIVFNVGSMQNMTTVTSCSAAHLIVLQSYYLIVLQSYYLIVLQSYYLIVLQSYYLF